MNMWDFLKSLLTTQTGVLLIVFGMLLIVIGIVGTIQGRIDPGKNGRIAAGALGFLSLIGGIWLQGHPILSSGPVVTKQDLSKTTQSQEQAKSGQSQGTPPDAAGSARPPADAKHELHTGSGGGSKTIGSNVPPAFVPPGKITPPNNELPTNTNPLQGNSAPAGNNSQSGNIPPPPPPPPSPRVRTLDMKSFEVVHDGKGISPTWSFEISVNKQFAGVIPTHTFEKTDRLMIVNQTGSVNWESPTLQGTGPYVIDIQGIRGGKRCECSGTKFISEDDARQGLPIQVHFQDKIKQVGEFNMQFAVTTK
ncbi:MAG: DUF308 domain-containing protein [Terracidiphilus sp.]|nr:DUF308 domain-containing protein [Terracidiphilus sp.]